MRIIKLLLILLIFPLNCFNQERKMIEKGDVLIKVSPMSMFPTNLPFLEFGASYHFTEKSGIQLKYGKKFDVYNPDDKHKDKGYKMTLEYMYFKKRMLYGSLECGYLFGKYTDSMDYYESDLSEVVITDEFVASVEKIFFSPKIGVMLFPSRRLLIDFYGGIGVQYHKREIDELEFSDGNIWTDYTEWGVAAPYEEIDKLQPRLTLGFNLNYRF